MRCINCCSDKDLHHSKNCLLLPVVADTEGKSKTIHITLGPEAREVVEKLRQDTGIPNTEAVARLLEWFAGLDRKFRLALLNRDASTRAELARLTLQDMARENGTPDTATRRAEIPPTRPRGK